MINLECNCKRKVGKSMSNQDSDKKTIAVLDALIKRYRKDGLRGIFSNCNDFGNPALNFLYCEVYDCTKNGQPMLALAGAGMFLEELTNELLVSSQVHKAQLKGEFNTWDEVMAFHEARYEDIESRKIEYKKDIKPALEKILEPSNLEAIELLRDFIRNTFIHSKRARLIKALQNNGVLPKLMPMGKATLSDTGVITKVEQVPMPLTHPLVRNIGFQVLAKQLAPAVLIFIFEMFKKYHKYIAPLEDKKIKFPGHNCEYD